MNKVIILGFIMLIIFAIIKMFNLEYFENFSINSHYCNNCGHRDRYSCGICTNCGFCESEDSAECIPGNRNGPFFRKDCLNWKHGRPFRYRAHGRVPKYYLR